MMRSWATPSGLAQRAIRGYQVLISSRSAARCRFRPTCSQYAFEALGVHGLLRGSWMAIRRLARCHPLSGKSFQFDPVPGRGD